MCYHVARDFDDVDVKVDVSFKVDQVLTKFDKSKNVFPNQDIPVIIPGSRLLDIYRWGLIPYWAKDIKVGSKLANARAETLDKKPSFKESFFKKRCLVLASGFYEWDKNKMPFYFEIKNRKIFAFAGLYDIWKNNKGNVIKSCTIITTEANDFIRPIHLRMPVILESEDYHTWLKSEDISEVKKLLKPFQSELVKFALDKKKIDSKIQKKLI